MIETNLFTKQKQTHRHRKQTDDYQKEKWQGGINQEFEIGRCKLTYINKQGPIVQHRGLYAISCNNLNGKEYKKYVAESLCSTPETNITL